MSKADRAKWDERYRAGAFAERPHPSALLEAWVSCLPNSCGRSRGRALDLACGAGRNSLFLAHDGFEVTGIDISSEGLKRAAASAAHEGLDVTWMRHDLDAGLPVSGPFDVVCLFRYLNADVIRRLPSLLATDGILMVEEHLATDQPVAGPSNPAFCAQPGELRRLLPGLDVLHQEEGIIADPDGRQVAIARLVGSSTR
ncbi:MAG: methyltransferase domain-containing protein [Gammaproteobacteria bacterium]|nr:methyltransferase domain-containing protein [Gammaproteobacteria bacterium]